MLGEGCVLIMFIPLVEVPSKIMGWGEERHYFLFHERNPNLPVEVVITRLPPHFEGEDNWHKHAFVEEFSVPLTGEIIIKEKKEGQVVRRRHLSQALLREDEWVLGISCSNRKEAVLHIDSASGQRREAKIVFDPQFSEGKDWHTVVNPTDDMVTMVTMKRVSKALFEKDPLVFKIDRVPKTGDN